MPSSSLKNRDDSVSQGPVATIDLGAVMAGAGEVGFEWSLATDDLVWDDNVATVLGVPADRIATGRSFAALFDPQTRGSRNDVILNARGRDDGSGIRYEAQYALLSEGARGKRVIVEEVGRWFADSKGRPARVAGVVRVINDRYEREQRILFLARYDELTGHLNRQSLLSALGEALNGALKGHAPIAFMVIAVDNFRALNDACGYDIADQVFAAVAQRIKSTLRDGDTIGRFGGNKIGVVLRSCADADMPLAAERFQAIAREEVITTHAGSVAVTVSCGGVTIPRYARTPTEAVARAQEALDAARLAGRGQFAAYRVSKDLGDRRRANATRSTDLVGALTANAVTLAHWPVVSAATRRLAFSEVGPRIGRPDGADSGRADLVVPEGFGLMRLVDDHTLQLVLAALQRSPQARIAFRVSPDTVGDSTWQSRASSWLAGRPALAERMIVQIPEAAFAKSGDGASRVAGTLRDLGCAVAVEDFGAGTLSFTALRAIPFDFARIDGGLIAGAADGSPEQAFVKGLLDVARALEVKTIASQITSEASATLLTQWGADYLAGTYIGEAAVSDVPPVEARD